MAPPIMSAAIAAIVSPRSFLATLGHIVCGIFTFFTRTAGLSCKPPILQVRDKNLQSV